MASLLNEGTADRAVRVVVGLVILSLTVVGPRSLWGLLGLLPLLTGVVGFCPAYRLIGLSTCKVAPRAGAAVEPRP